MKICCKCKFSKLLIEYHKDKTAKDGHSYCCKKCAIERSKKYYFSDIEHSKKIRSNWREKNKETIKEKNKEYREKNINEILDKKRKYYLLNKESILLKNKENEIRHSYTKKWKTKNKERLKEYSDIYRITNKDKKKIWDKKTHDNARDNLNDSYVKQLLKQCGFNNNIITNDLIEFKREHIKLVRLIKGEVV